MRSVKYILGSILLTVTANVSNARDWPTYNNLTIAGWQIYVEKALIQKNDFRVRKALKFLDEKLHEAENVLPEKHLDKLKTVPIWLSENNGQNVEFYFYERRVYRKERNPEKIGGFEIQNINKFIALMEVAPSVVIHELAHAYHKMNYKIVDKHIMRAFKNANSKKLYKKPDTRRDHKTRQVYAATSPYEYFADLSAIYFVGNYYYPFNSSDLKIHDPLGYEMIEQVWE